jgi:hypothetical protein
MNILLRNLGLLKILGVVLVVINLLYLNYRIASESGLPPPVDTPITKSIASPLPLENDAVALPSAYIELVREATSSLTIQVSSLENQLAQESGTNVTDAPATISVREFYIPLGTGSTNSQEWVDLPGVEANVAPSNYGSIKEMYFEASLRIPNGTGRAYARLKNVTDNTSLIESEVFREGSSTGLISSGKIPIPQATKLYRVQVKSTLGTEMKLDNARIKIFVK